MHVLVLLFSQKSTDNIVISVILFQWLGLWRTMAERQKARPRHGNSRTLDISWRMDSGIQGTLRCQTIYHIYGEVRRYMGQWSSRWLRFRNLCRQRWVKKKWILMEILIDQLWPVTLGNIIIMGSNSIEE